jgi:hypothetical protein
MAIAGEKNIEAGKGIPSLGCCGEGGTWAMPYDEERLAYGIMEADQIKATGAKIVVDPCPNPGGKGFHLPDQGVIHQPFRHLTPAGIFGAKK